MPSWHLSERPPGSRVGLPVATVTGTVVALAGVGFVGAGLWARREVELALTRERVVSTSARRRPMRP